MDGMRKVEVLRAACCIAGIDGETADSERRILKMLADEVGVGDASLSAMVQRAETDNNFFKEQFRVLKTDPKQTMQLLLGVALSDGKLLAEEKILLRRFSERLDVTSQTFERWLGEAEEYLASKGQNQSS